MSKIEHIPSGLIEPLQHYVRERDPGASSVLEALGVELESPTVSAERFCALLESVWERDPVSALGIRLGLAGQPSQFGVVGYMVSSCGTLGQALARYHRYQELLQSGVCQPVPVVDWQTIHANPCGPAVPQTAGPWRLPGTARLPGGL